MEELIGNEGEEERRREGEKEKEEGNEKRRGTRDKRKTAAKETNPVSVKSSFRPVKNAHKINGPVAKTVVLRRRKIKGQERGR